MGPRVMGADAPGNLYYGPYNAARSTNQTFLVELDGQPGIITTTLSPEPAFYGALALGLSGLMFAVRRKKQA